MKRIPFFILSIMLCLSGYAKEPQRPDSYNYRRGTELIDDDQYDEGIDFLRRELQQNPKNGYAYAWLAAAYAHKNERGTALNFINTARKYLPQNDKYYRAWSQNLQGCIYLSMNDTTAALNAFSEAVRIEPQNDDWYTTRGMLFRDLKQWDKSDEDFQSVIKLNPGRINGYLMLAQNLYLQERYEEALKRYKYAHQLAERSYTLSGMAKTEMKLKHYETAVTHLIEALKMEDGEDTCMEILTDYARDDEFVSIVSPALTVQIKKNPNQYEWYVYRLMIEQTRKQYEDAILTCKKIRTIIPDAYFDDWLALLYADMGDFEHALQYSNDAVAADSTDSDYRGRRASIYSEMDSTALVYADINYLINQTPDKAELYFTRGSINLFNQRDKEAVEDYNMGMAIESSDDWERYMRGRCLEAIGETDKARKDYQQVENNCKRNEVLMFVKASLGKREEAMQLADSLLRADTIDHKYRYNVACAYALLGEKELALAALEGELQDGYVRFTHLRHDPDLRSLQGDELELLLKKYEQIRDERIQKFNTEQGAEQGEERVVEVPFSAANGVTKVDCTINGLPLNFVFDTGAADVTISQVEANFMFKNGYLDSKDVIGSQRYQTADGNISVGTTINLRQINFGGLELRDVRASVVKSQNAPLLLGQSVLGRLGKIEIDNQNRVLKITTK